MARDAGVDVVVSAWLGLPAGARADRLAGNGDLNRAATSGGPGWADLNGGKVVEALRIARAPDDDGVQRLSLLEAEALVAAGAITAGLQCLARLSDAGDVPATVALARRRHALGDHAGAVRAASRLPMHAQASLAAARALMALHRPTEALRRIEPFLIGGAPIPDTMTAGAFSALAASALAYGGQRRLAQFAAQLLECPDAAADTTPSVARTAWTGGLAREAWDRFDDDTNPWMAAGRIELAALAGNPALVRGLMQRAGPLGATLEPTLLLLEGGTVPDGVLTEGDSYHVWRTHPTRWQPWIDAALESAADVVVCDLAAGNLPDDQAIPAGVVDDGALIAMVQPKPVPRREPQGSGVWIDRNLCTGVGIGHDWPQDEQAALESLVTQVPHGEAAVWITGTDRALAHARDGRPNVIVAPPGDPFWAGPLPEQAWPACRVVRADPTDGWNGAAARVAAAAQELADGP